MSEEVLEHYASKYYDPVKAREYYLKNRELKGREKAANDKLGDNQKRGITYVKDTITKQKREALKTTAEKYKAQQLKTRTEGRTAIERAQELRAKRLEEIQQRATEAVEKAQEKLMALRELIYKQTEVPANASPRVRALMEKLRARRTGKAVDSTRSATAKIRKESTEERQKVNDAAREELTKMRDDLKASVTKAREEYNSAKKALADKYDKDLKTEIQNIKTKVKPKNDPKTKRKS